MKEVFAVIGKMPKKGFSKTRLAKDIGEELAFQSYEAFISDFFDNYFKHAKNHKLYFAGTPCNDETKVYFESLFKRKNIYNYSFHFQSEVPFFERLTNLFETIRKNEGECFVHLTGTDIPDFPFHYLKNVDVNVKDTKDECVYIGPDDDGGYYYLGTKTSNTFVFDLDKSVLDGNENVLAATQQQCDSKSVEYKLLPEWSDIDYKEDFKKLESRSKKDVYPETAKFLPIILS